MAAGHPEYTSDSVAGLVLGITEDRHVSIIPNYPSWRNRPASAFGYQAAARIAIGDDSWRARPISATSEYSPSRQGVWRSIAVSDHCRCVSTPRWARASSKVTSIGHRLTNSAGIAAASSSGRVEK